MKTPIRCLLTKVWLSRWIRWLGRRPQPRLVFVAALAALAVGGGAKSPSSGSGLLERVGSWPGFGRGPASDVAIAGHYAYVAMGEGGLVVLDVADPAKPVRVGGYLPAGRTQQVRVVGSRAYLGTMVDRGGGCQAEGWRGYLVILDVNDPTQPAPLGSYITGSAITSLFVDGDRVYLGDDEPTGHSERSFRILDVSNPARPVTLSVDQTRGANAIWAGGGQVCVASGSELIVLDVTQPASSTVVTNLSSESGETIQGLQAVGHLLYVISGDSDSGKLIIYDTSQPSAPRHLATLDLNHTALDLQVDGSYAYLAMADAGLAVIDVSDPSKPVRVGTWDTAGVALQVEIAGDHAFVADYHGGLQVFDIRNPSQLAQVASFDTGLTSREVLVSGGKACVLSSNTPPSAYPSESRSRLEIVDISNPTQPALLASREAPWNDLIDMLPGLGFDRSGAGQHVADGYAYSGLGWEGFDVNDVHNPMNAVKVGGYDTLGEVHDLWVTNHYAYVAEGWEGLEVFDVSNPAQPVPIGGATTRGQARGVQVSGNYAYVAEGGSGLAILSIPPGPVTILEDPTSLNAALGDSATLTVRAYGRGPLSYQWYRGESGDVSHPVAGANGASLTTPVLTEAAAYWVRVSDGTAISDSRTAWINLVPPVSVELVGLWPGQRRATGGFCADVAVSGQHAFLADGDGGLKIIDVSDTTRPILTGVYSSYTRFVAANAPFVYLGADTLQILDVSDPTRPTRIANLGEWVNHIFLAGDYAYFTLSGWSSPFRTMDVRNPAQPKIAVSQALSDQWGTGGMSFVGRYAGVAQGWGGLQILDLSVPTEPKWVGAYYAEAVNDVAMRGDIACVILGSEVPALEVIDLRDFQRPTRTARLSLPLANKVALMGSYACVTGEGLQVFDLGDPHQPVRVGSHKLGFETRGLQVVGNLVYVAAGEYGLAIYRLTPQLKLNPPVLDGSGLRLSWLGAQGIRLQRATSLSDQDWQDVPNSEGVSDLQLSPTDHAAFFRLVKP